MKKLKTWLEKNKAMILVDGVKAIGKTCKAQMMHFTEEQAGWIFVFAVAVNVILMSFWVLCG